MDTGSEAVSVRLLDKEYLVACPEDEQDGLLRAARYLNGRMKEIRDGGKVIGIDRIAVMVALNIAYDLLQQQSQRTRYGHNFGVRVHALCERVDEVLHEGGQLEL